MLRFSFFLIYYALFPNLGRRSSDEYMAEILRRRQELAQEFTPPEECKMASAKQRLDQWMRDSGLVLAEMEQEARLAEHRWQFEAYRWRPDTESG